jgi:hypothetical protein
MENKSSSANNLYEKGVELYNNGNIPEDILAFEACLQLNVETKIANIKRQKI